MVEHSRTKDERFMMRLYEEAAKRGDMDEPLDRYVIGSLIGIQPKAVDTICNLLAQANFIKKHSKNDVSITPHGMKLVENLNENK